MLEGSIPPMRTTATPRKRRYQRTQQAILEAASDIIRNEGIGALSMRSLAERIDYSPAGLYEYYSGKEEIVAAVCQVAFDQLAAMLRSTDPALPPGDFLRECGLNYVRFATENTDAFLLAFTYLPLHAAAAQPDTDSAAQLRASPAFKVLQEAVERCVAAGLFQERPGWGVFEMSMACWQMVHGVAMLAVTVLRQQPGLDLSRRAIEVLQAGLAAR